MDFAEFICKSVKGLIWVDHRMNSIERPRRILWSGMGAEPTQSTIGSVRGQKNAYRESEI